MGKIAMGLVMAATSGCALLQVPPTPPFEVVIAVESDPGQPVADASVWKGGKEGPHTAADGRVNLKLSGQEGESVDLTVRCPTGYVSPSRPITVLLRRLEGRVPELSTRCEPSVRELVIAVRAENGPNIPVNYLGRTIGRTDPSGAFTTTFRLPPGDGIELVLDTSDPAFTRINPKMPGATFTIKPYDDVVTFDQTFRWDPPPRPRAPKAPQRPTAIPARQGQNDT